jgi:hydrogenase maturation protease
MLIAAIGNRFRSDDGVAWQVADAVRRDLSPNVRVVYAVDVLSIVDDWRGEDLAILIDAVQSGAPPGTVHEIDATGRLSAPIPAHASTHDLELPHAIELARRLDRLPAKLIVVGIEGHRFDYGDELSPAVAAAVPRAAAVLRRLAVDGLQRS